MKKTYTEKEIELYGVLAELFLLSQKEIRSFYNYIMKAEKSMKALESVLTIQIKMNKILKELKIPNKFLILRRLEEKK